MKHWSLNIWGHIILYTVFEALSKKNSPNSVTANVWEIELFPKKVQKKTCSINSPQFSQECSGNQPLQLYLNFDIDQSGWHPTRYAHCAASALTASAGSNAVNFLHANTHMVAKILCINPKMLVIIFPARLFVLCLLSFDINVKNYENLMVLVIFLIDVCSGKILVKWAESMVCIIVFVLSKKYNLA